MKAFDKNKMTDEGCSASDAIHNSLHRVVEALHAESYSLYDIELLYHQEIGVVCADLRIRERCDEP